MVQSSDPQSISWIAAWTKALLRPSVRTFTEFASSPNAKMFAAFLWILLIGPVSLVPSILAAMVSSLKPDPHSSGFLMGASLDIAYFIGLSLLYMTLATLIFFVVVSAQSIVLALLHAGGKIGQVVYTEAAIYAPVLLIFMIISNFNAVLGIPVLLYGCLLAPFAVKGAQPMEWTKAILVSLPPAVIVGAAIVLLYSTHFPILL